jgi:hypothetical protein
LANRVDLVVSDGATPGCEGLRALHLARQFNPSASLVMLPAPAVAVAAAGAPGVGIDDAGLIALGVTRVLPDDMDHVGVVVADALLEQLAERDPDPTAGYEMLVSVVRQLSLAADMDAMMAIVRTAARRLTGADGATFGASQRL